MSCGCKTNSFKSSKSDVFPKELNVNITNSFSNFLVKILAFSLMMLLLPVIMLAIIWFIFELIMLNKEIDMKKVVRVLSSKIKPFNEDYEQDDDEEDEEDEFTEENYEMVDVEDITPITSK